jgi:hypothetical protein
VAAQPDFHRQVSEFGRGADKLGGALDDGLEGGASVIVKGRDGIDERELCRPARASSARAAIGGGWGRAKGQCMAQPISFEEARSTRR